MFSARVPPIVSGWLPGPKPTSGTSTPIAAVDHSVGHAFLRARPMEPFSIPSPTLLNSTVSNASASSPRPASSSSSSKQSGPSATSASTLASASDFTSSSPPTPASASNTPALEIRELGYGVFYPIVKGAKSLGPKGKSKTSVNWVPEPDAMVVAGYEKFLGPRGMKWLIQALKLVVGRMKMPVIPLAPLAPPPASSSTAKHPLVIFSHGLAGTRNTYSQYCSALAAKGYVVLAIEHRDGSGPAVLLPESSSGGDIASATTSQAVVEGERKVRLYTKLDDLEWNDGKHHRIEDFRSLQLDMRIREVYEVFHSFRRLVDHTADESSSGRINLDAADEATQRAWLESMSGKVDCSTVDLTGHSFGGGTVMHLLQTPPPKISSLPRIPAKHCIALDPWLEPLPLPAPDTPSQPDVPLLVINSPGFTVWSDHFTRLVKQVKEAKGSLITLLGSNHQSFSDFPLLSPSSPAFASSLLSTIHDLSFSFLNGALAQSDPIKGKEPDGGKFARGEDGKGMAGKKGEVVVHLLGDGA